MTLIVPPELPVRVTVQLALDELPPPVPSEQLVLVGETPAPLAETLTVPPGVVCEPPMSETVTVHVLDVPTVTGVAQLTDVVVVRFTLTEAVPELSA